jgi:hypothetical protein
MDELISTLFDDESEKRRTENGRFSLKAAFDMTVEENIGFPLRMFTKKSKPKLKNV